jgi:hypothetical protein
MKDARVVVLKVRLSKEEMSKLESHAGVVGVSKSEVIRDYVKGLSKKVADGRDSD